MNSGRIGILGGTFDPIHFGHLAIAEEARVALHLTSVLIIPAGAQPLKTGRHVASAQQRLAMARLACATNPAYDVLDLEIERAGPSYTVVTLAQLHERYPGELHLILGADALNDLPRWREVERVLALARLVGVARPGITLDLARMEAAIPGVRSRLTLVEGPRLEISSTNLRRRVAAGQPIRYQTPDAVVEYIEHHRLYR